MTHRTLASAIARSFLAGDPEPDQLFARAAHVLSKPWRWLRPLAGRFTAFSAGRTRLTHRDTVRFLLQDAGFRRACRKHSEALGIAAWLEEPQLMQPVPAARTWEVPPIESVGALASLLGVSIADLEWFADLKGLAVRAHLSPLNHYHYRAVPKSSGAVRLLEAPKPRIKALQQKILAEILDRIPVHPAAHGFVRGRSITTFAAPHAGRRVLLRLDLRDFFPTFPVARVEALFRTAGYPEPVAARLAGICTNRAPRILWKDCCQDLNAANRFELRLLYGRRHLPQGAPASPALANLCMYRVDCRLTGLAKACGAHYSRYADDLAFSGDRSFESGVDRFATHVASILLEEGLHVHHRKTRVMRQGVRQHLTGLVANAKVNVLRPDFDCLKAILTNCVRHGPDSQNRDAHPDFRSHLEGRIAFMAMVNPEKAERLRRIFQQIRWP
jgi:hypothetical protein